MKRIQVLDVFRGLAALGVVFFHYTKFFRELTHSAKPYFAYGYTGVFFFFMISGFVIFLTVKQSRSATNFILRRFSRLYPTFWFCLLVTTIAVRCFGLTGREVSWRGTLINITMIPKCFGAKDVDGVYWTLLYEFFFYVFMAFIILIKKTNKLFLWILPWLLLCYLRLFVHALGGPLTYLLNLNYGGYFIAGIMFYQLKFISLKDYRYHVIIILTLILNFLSAQILAEAILGAVFYLIFYLFVFDKLNFIQSPALIFLGRISFPLYLVHQNIGYIIINYIYGINKQAPIYILIIPILVSIGIASLIHLYVEKPTIKWFRKLFEVSDRNYSISQLPN